MIEIKQYGSIEDGKFIARRKDVLNQELKDAGNVHDCILTITGSNKRTLDQNSYAHAVCAQVASRLRQDGWTFTSYEVYKKMENDKCMWFKENEITGKTHEYIKPLKEFDTARFFEIVEEFRQDMMFKLSMDIHTPAQHYKITEKAYDLMKQGVITYLDAKKMTDAELDIYEH